MKRRLFVALPIASDLREEILTWGSPFNQLPVRWLTGKNLHITLVPPWYTEEVGDVVTRLKGVEGAVNTFDVCFSRVAYGPTMREPRVIWTEGETPQTLSALKTSIEKTLDVEPEKRSFKLHLTLARFRPETFTSFPIKKLDEKIVWHQHCDRFVLMESHLSRAGADYEILESFFLNNR